MARHGVAILLMVLGLAGCGPSGGLDPTPAPPTPEPDESMVLTQDGFGDLRLDRDVLSLGVTDVETAFGTTLRFAPQTDDCSLGILEDREFAVVYDGNTAVLGFVVGDPAVTTPEGIGVGSTVDDLVAAYGDAVGALDGVVSQTGGPLAVVDDLTDPGAPPTASSLHYAFDTDEAGTVTRLRSGFWPWVGYTDYCSSVVENARTGWPLTGPK